jgi:hypothetical protein
MMSKWKIFYTDGSSFMSDEVGEDVTKIPTAKRRGVHCVIQPFDKERARETMESDFYLYMKSGQAWCILQSDGILEAITDYFNDIECILSGRTQTTNAFWNMRNKVKEDTDIVGALELDGGREHPSERQVMNFNQKEDNRGRWRNTPVNPLLLRDIREHPKDDPFWLDKEFNPHLRWPNTEYEQQYERMLAAK